ncbi:saccharopine dehydrogenase C-terminal domain-containing protein [Tropicimonas sp. IMCC6043]|uniref:saccharopine dehydrogenase C-terminal domain-containing protein n=1 Tax=Tropicimonas sp. IMCC6043 TaxID=2510645 RepID=UPI00101B7D2F|nr:saccharopine dehydrogenase C-terminal domain-containing protein [Tropicimonas sp. IMCC6043]RYH09647.1 saccharopine dehydrogenase [Tropicimonas sp. IMCC6043]
MTIHWCGTGLSAIPGLRKLLEFNNEVCVWNRTPARAFEAVGDLTDWIEPFDLSTLREAVSPGDVVVSMLPGNWHVPLAELCVAERAHFVSSSYISPEMQALDASAKAAGVCLVNEVGLDPGIDHLMAHWLMADMRRGGHDRPGAEYEFLSYCGGVPSTPNAFRYKFSWSPLGVLRALMSPSRSIRDYSVLDIARPWDAVTRYDAPLPQPESFEVYPNRDSLPFIETYGFEEGWNIRQFVRGTLRLGGWTDAWTDVFAEIEALDGTEESEARLKALSDRLWAENAYAPDEPDRVVLCVSLKVSQDGVPSYHKTYALDAIGDTRGSAMARLVSQTVALAVQSAEAREIAPGVSAAPNDPRLVERWLAATDVQAQYMAVVDHLA